MIHEYLKYLDKEKHQMLLEYPYYVDRSINNGS